MQAFLPAIFIGVFIILIVGPPISFLRTTYRCHRNWHDLAGLVSLFLWMAVASVPLVINLIYLGNALPLLFYGEVERNQALALALLVSWTAFWARVLMRRTHSRKRRLLR